MHTLWDDWTAGTGGMNLAVYLHPQNQAGSSMCSLSGKCSGMFGEIVQTGLTAAELATDKIHSVCKEDIRN
jgi:hypothetical protein